MNLSEQVERLLPGFNCGECGQRSCQNFAQLLASGGGDTGQCPYLGQERFAGHAEGIREVLSGNRAASEETVRGVIDGLLADFSLGPLPGEPSCREDLFPFDRSLTFCPGDLIRYRPLGCPVTHFARVLGWEHGILTVHMVGPLHLLGQQAEYNDLGVCMVAAFEGQVVRGSIPSMGQTVRFLPEHCMMQKVHSGVVVHSEGRMVRIEGIDLKVW